LQNKLFVHRYADAMQPRSGGIRYANVYTKGEI
jgi:hypothetical protein